MWLHFSIHALYHVPEPSNNAQISTEGAEVHAPQDPAKQVSKRRKKFITNLPCIETLDYCRNLFCSTRATGPVPYTQEFCIIGTLTDARLESGGAGDAGCRNKCWGGDAVGVDIATIVAGENESMTMEKRTSDSKDRMDNKCVDTVPKPDILSLSTSMLNPIPKVSLPILGCFPDAGCAFPVLTIFEKLEVLISSYPNSLSSKVVV